MSDWTHRSSVKDHRHLAQVFLRNGRDFHGVAFEVWNLYPEINRHHTSIAIELALKACLLHRRISDDWCRVHIRHDLVKALKCARRIGFKDVPPLIPRLAYVLTPYYQTHTICEMPPELVASVDWFGASADVADLLDAVGAALEGRAYEPMTDEPEPPSQVAVGGRLEKGGVPHPARSSAELGFPGVDRACGHAVLARQLARFGSGVVLPQDSDDLLFRESRSFQPVRPFKGRTLTTRGGNAQGRVTGNSASSSDA